MTEEDGDEEKEVVLECMCVCFKNKSGEAREGAA